MAELNQSIWINKYARRLCVALFMVASFWLLTWLAARWLIVSAPLDHADAIVVLSGSSTFVERTHHAAQLYAEHRSEKILLTDDNRQGGWSSVEQRNPYFYERARDELTRLGVPLQNIEVVRPPVYSTWDEATLLSKYCQDNNLRSLLVVTSAYHSRRALWTFRNHFRGTRTQVGLDPVETGIQTPSPPTWWLCPRGWQMVFIEYSKLIYYRCRS